MSVIKIDLTISEDEKTVTVPVPTKEIINLMDSDDEKDLTTKNPPLETPQVPAEIPQVPVETPQVPVETPQVPVETPQVPVETPQVPVEIPQVPAETPQDPMEIVSEEKDSTLPSIQQEIPQKPAKPLAKIISDRKREDVSKWYRQAFDYFEPVQCELAVWDHPYVVSHGDSLRLIALDPTMSFFKRHSKYMEEGILKIPIFEETDSPLIWTCADFAALTIGKQRKFYMDHMIAYIKALLHNKAELAAAHAYVVFLIGKYGSLKKHPEGNANEMRKQFPAYSEDELDKVVNNPLYHLWSVFYRMAGRQTFIKPDHIMLLFTNYKESEEILKIYLFRLIAIACKTWCFSEVHDGDIINAFDCEGIKHSINLKPSKIIGEITSTLQTLYGAQQFSWEYLEVVYYRTLKNVHSENGLIESDEEDNYYEAFGEEEESTKLPEIPVILRPQAISVSISASQETGLKEKVTKKRKSPIQKSPKVSKKPKNLEVPQGFSIADLPHLNVRKSKEKKHNVVCEDFVYRGPYKSVAKITKLADILTSLNLENRFPNVKFLKPIDCHKDEKGDFFVKYPILATTAPETWSKEEESDKHDGKIYTTIESSSMGIEDYASYVVVHPEDFVDKHSLPITVAFMWLAILHVADRGLDNVLLVNGDLVFVDLDQWKLKKPLKNMKEDEISFDFACSKGFKACLDDLFNKGKIQEDAKKGHTISLGDAYKKAFEKNREDLKKELVIMEEKLGIRGIKKGENLVEIAKSSDLGKALDALGIDLASVLDTYDLMYGNIHAE